MELHDIAQAIVSPGRGILAADESTGTMGKRLAGIGVESTEDARRQWRELLFTTPGMEAWISGVILFDETIRQSAVSGEGLSSLLQSRGIVPGIKVDAGAHPMDDAPGELLTSGLDGLPDRLAEYYALGARFTKWRAVIGISEDLPTDTCIDANADALARYALYSQQAGLVPIVEPEVLMDGSHDIDRCHAVTLRTLQRVFAALGRLDVDLKGMLLKPNMVISALGCPGQASANEVAVRSVDCFRESVPPEVPGIVFLSGGQSPHAAMANLSAMNALADSGPWELSFSYGRALQADALVAWGGRQDQLEAGQEAFAARARLTSAARCGTWTEEMEMEAALS